MPFLLRCCALAWLVCGSFWVFAEAKIKPLDIYPDDMLILKFTMGSRVLLAENIIAYPNSYSIAADSAQNSIALSFLEFVNAVEFPIDIAAEQGVASGWFIDKDRVFDLDLKKAKVIVGQTRHNILPGQIQWYGDEIFVDIDLLAKWFGLTFSYDANRQALDMSAEEVLPFQRKWARKAQREKLNRWMQNNRDALTRKLSLPLHRAGYDFISKPGTRLYANLGYKHHANGAKGQFYRYNGTVNHDLLYQSAKWYFKGDDSNGLDDVRLTLGRQDEGKELTALGLSSYQLGDSYSFDVPLIAHSVLGTGATLSSFDLGFRSQTNAVTIRGDSQPGWDIELYRNKALINAAKVNSDGTYEFVDAPLLSGINDVKLVFYGPRGEKVEQNERYYMHPDLAKKGQLSWRASIHKAHDLLFDRQTAYGSQQVGEPRAVVQSEYGLTDNMSISAALVVLPSSQWPKSNQYLTVGSRFTIGGSYFRQQFVRDLDNQSGAVELFASSQLGDLNVNGSFQYFTGDYHSDYRKANAEPLKSVAQLNFHQSVASAMFSHLSFALRAKHRQYYDRSSTTDITFKQSVAKGQLSLTNEIHFNDSQFSGLTTFNLPSIWDVKMRGKLNYGLTDGIDPESLSLSGEMRLARHYRLTTELNQHLQAGRSSRLDLRLVRAFEGFDVDFSAGYQSGGNYNVALTLSMQMDGFGFRDKNETELGKVNARVFLDNNANKTFDEGDTPLPDVHFSVDGRAGDEVTDQNGVVGLNVDADMRTVIKVSSGVYGDHYWDVESPERAVVTREGKSLTVDFAARFNGEIEGSVYKDQQSLRAVAGLVIELLDGEGKVINTVKSGFDGFYLFEKVPFGHYQVQVAIEQLKRQGMNLVAPQSVEVSDENDIVSGIDFYLNGP